jgi:predicted PurR-regulated permease PerM
MPVHLLNQSIKILFFIVLLITALYFGASFLVPITFGVFFSFLLLPVSIWLEGKGISKGLATVMGVLLLVIGFAAIGWLLSWQVSNMAEDTTAIKENFSKKSNQVAQFVNKTFGISLQKQQQYMRQQTASIANKASATVASIGGILTKMIIVLVYTFLFIYYRSHFRRFIMQLVEKDKQQEAMEVIDRAGKVTQRYITGLFSMIFCLWIMYGIGFTIIGVKNAVFFAILCGLLELIPYVGNLTGNAITILGVILQSGSNMMILEVLVVYSVVQFIQSYLLAPLIVGRVVRINPVATIVGFVGGEAIWGVPGMVLVIPILGITKIIFDHVEPLKPYGFLLGEEKKSNTNVIDKIKKWFKKT